MKIRVLEYFDLKNIMVLIITPCHYGADGHDIVIFTTFHHLIEISKLDHYLFHSGLMPNWPQTTIWSNVELF